jgi:uncharacterized protein
MRGIDGEQVLLRIILSESRRSSEARPGSRAHDRRPVHERLIELLRREGLAGATVLKGVAGFGRDHAIHTVGIEAIAQGLPIVVEVVDTPERIDAVLAKLDDLGGGGIITTERARVIHYAPPRAPGGAAEAQGS